VKCNQARELLSPYLDGELEPSREELLSDHLGICPGCSREMDELKKAMEMLRRLPELAPAGGFRAGLRECLAGEQLSVPVNYRSHDSFARRGARLWPRLAVAATLILAVGITSLWYGLAGPNRNITTWAKEQLLNSLLCQDKDIQDKNIQGKETKAGSERSNLSGKAPPEIKDNALEDGTASGPGIMTSSPGSAKIIYDQDEDLPAATPLPEETRKASEITGPSADRQTPQAASGAVGPLAALAPGGSDGGGGASLKVNTVSSKILREDRIEIEAGDFAKLTPLVSSYIPPQERAAFTDSGPKTGRLEIKVPAEQLPALLQKIKAQVGIARQEEKETDVTEDYRSLVERLQQLEEKERQLQAGLKSPAGLAMIKSTSEEELSNIQGEVQTVRAKLEDMEEKSNIVSVQIILK